MSSIGRRQFFLGAAAFVAAAQGRAQQARTTRPGDRERAPLIDDLVAANHILYDQNIVDAFGHISVRVAPGSDRYLLSRSMAPILVTAKDIMEFDLDSVAQNKDERTGYRERFIHGQIYRARPDVMSIVHCHAPSLIPFGITKHPMRPVFHQSSFIAEGVPVFEIRDTAGDTDMLIGTNELGKALAASLGNKPAVLMRGHGAVVVGKAIPDAVARSVYLEVNARVQAQAMSLGGEVTYVSPGEAAKRVASGDEFTRAWEMWKRQVK